MQALVTVGLKRHIMIGPLLGNRYSRLNVAQKNPRLGATTNYVGVSESLAGNISMEMAVIEFGRDMDVSVAYVLYAAWDELSI